jgi:hypothetical protein
MSPGPERYRVGVTPASVTGGESANDLVDWPLRADADPAGQARRLRLIGDLMPTLVPAGSVRVVLPMVQFLLQSTLILGRFGGVLRRRGGAIALVHVRPPNGWGQFTFRCPRFMRCETATTETRRGRGIPSYLFWELNPGGDAMAGIVVLVVGGLALVVGVIWLKSSSTERAVENFSADVTPGSLRAASARRRAKA